ncbi:ubiquitin conjugation [Cyclospora cayetanensis]|uniref:RING-type E3 ubiquitin transferase n=1 Tax=Cyclospora cayetanensis TaxID=88456 RepID=A0A1D3D7S8_9EIME|nr:ubiquitin conjugation [Cyclospora cayetanensis]
MECDGSTATGRAEDNLAAPQEPDARGEAATPPEALAAGLSVQQAGTKRSELSPEALREVKEDRFLQATLRVRVNDGFFPNCVFLPKTMEECRREGQPPRMRIELVQEILIEMTQILWANKSGNLFRAAAEAFHKISDDTYTKYLPTETRAESAAAVQEQLVNYTVLLLTCLELFELEDTPPTAAVRQMRLAAVAAIGVATSAFVEPAFVPHSVVDSTSMPMKSLQESPGSGEGGPLEAAFGPAVDGLFAALTERGVGGYKSPAVGAIRLLSSFKPIASVITRRSCFLPPFAPPLPTAQPGFFLQEESLLGRLLSFTPLDGPVLPVRSRSSAADFGLKGFVRGNGVAALVRVLGGIGRSLAAQPLFLLKEISIALVCTAEHLRFTALLASNEARAKAAHAHLMMQQHTPESADPLHAFLLKAQGQNSFGFLVNVFHVLLLLVDPIKTERMFVSVTHGGDVLRPRSAKTLAFSHARHLLGLCCGCLLGLPRASVAAVTSVGFAMAYARSIFEVSPFYATCGSAEDSARLLVSGPLRREALLGEDETVAFARKFYAQIAAQDADAKFTTEVFWLAIRAVRLCFNARRCVHPQAFFASQNHLPFCGCAMLQQQQALPYHRASCCPVVFFSAVLASLSTCGGWSTSSSAMTAECNKTLPNTGASSLNSWGGVRLYWHFAHLFCSWLLGCMYTYTADGKEDSKATGLLNAQKWRAAALLTQLPPGGAASPAKPSPQFALLPSGIVDDLMLSIRHMAELQAFYSGLRGGQGGEVSPCSSMDAELVAATCIAVMGSPGFFRSVHTRCDGVARRVGVSVCFLSSACRTLHRLFLLDEFRCRLEALPVAKNFLLPALVEVFIDSERGSYYDRINFRIPIVDMLSRLLAHNEYTGNMRLLAEAYPEKFLHMVHLLLNDIATLVDQAMEALVEIRKRQLDGRDREESATPGQGSNVSANADATAGAASSRASAGGSRGAPSASGEESDADEMADSLEGRSTLEREPWRRLQSTARDLCSLGHSACALFTLLSRHCGTVISGSSSILPQAVTTLDCCLDHLVGPRCLQLKVNSMETYNFRPKDWLSKADKTNGDAITGEILRDGRYYKHANIAKACRIARREGLMAPSLLNEFYLLVKRLAEVEETGKGLDLDEVPAEYLDPIMADLMQDPVLLPSSKVIMDRRNIERHLMSDPSDPFNRAPLTREQLVPQPELKKEIEAFLESKNAAALATKPVGQ